MQEAPQVDKVVCNVSSLGPDSHVQNVGRSRKPFPNRPYIRGSFLRPKTKVMQRKKPNYPQALCPSRKISTFQQYGITSSSAIAPACAINKVTSCEKGRDKAFMNENLGVNDQMYCKINV